MPRFPLVRRLPALGPVQQDLGCQRPAPQLPVPLRQSRRTRHKPRERHHAHQQLGTSDFGLILLPLRSPIHEPPIPSRNISAPAAAIHRQPSDVYETEITMAEKYTTAEVAKHKSEADGFWIIVENEVYDVTSTSDSP